MALFEHVKAQPVIGLDQTGWPRLDVQGSKPWQMWCLTAPGVVVHRIRDDKSAATFKELVSDYTGAIVADTPTPKAEAPPATSRRSRSPSTATACTRSARALRCPTRPPPARTSATFAIERFTEAEHLRMHTFTMLDDSSSKTS